MKIIIPHELLLKKSNQTGVSIQLLTKRFLRYRHTTGIERTKKNCCGYCKASSEVTIEGEKRFQCEIIGIGKDFYADIKTCWTCDLNTVSDYKIKTIGDRKDE